MRRFWRRHPVAEKVELPKVWVWKHHIMLRKLIATRFFFKETLDLNEIVGGDSEKFRVPFAETPGLVGVNVYASYLAVQWWRPEDDSQMGPIAEEIVAIGIDLLSKRFDWQNPQIEYISSEAELLDLRQREAHDRRWILGVN